MSLPRKWQAQPISGPLLPFVQVPKGVPQAGGLRQPSGWPSLVSPSLCWSRGPPWAGKPQSERGLNEPLCDLGSPCQVAERASLRAESQEGRPR